MNRWVLIGVLLIVLGLLYRRNPTMFRRGIWIKTSIAIRTLSPEKYVAYIRGVGLMLILVGVGMLLYGLDPLIEAVTLRTIDRLRLTPTERAVTGMLVGAVGGAAGGWIGALLEALYLHPLGRTLESAGRLAIADHLASIGLKIGLILGAIVGGVVGWSSSLAVNEPRDDDCARRAGICGTREVSPPSRPVGKGGDYWCSAFRRCMQLCHYGAAQH